MPAGSPGLFSVPSFLTRGQDITLQAEFVATVFVLLVSALPFHSSAFSPEFSRTFHPFLCTRNINRPWPLTRFPGVMPGAYKAACKGPS